MPSPTVYCVLTNGIRRWLLRQPDCSRLRSGSTGTARGRFPFRTGGTGGGKGDALLGCAGCRPLVSYFELVSSTSLVPEQRNLAPKPETSTPGACIPNQHATVFKAHPAGSHVFTPAPELATPNASTTKVPKPHL